MMAPSGYPLPWCDVLDAPYWQINIQLCSLSADWKSFQRGRAMADVIPVIDRLIAGTSTASDPQITGIVFQPA